MIPKLYFVFILFQLGIISIIEAEKIQSELKSLFNTGKTANIIISFDVPSSQTLEKISSKVRAIPERPEKLKTIAQALEDQAITSQREALELLQKNPSFKHRILWITNQIYVQNAPKDVADQLEAISEVTQIELDTFKIDMAPDNEENKASKNKQSKHPTFGNLINWGLEQLKIPEIWSQGYYGQNVLVAHVDSGPRFHDANRDNFAGLDNFGWLDPAEESKYPTSEKDHGTHTMGILAGHNGIGVAPGSRWMACRYGIVHPFPDIINCYQHYLCPGGSKNSSGCSRAPHVVSNSWGSKIVPGGGYDQSILSAIEAFKETRTFIVFAAGNSGPKCQSLTFPANTPSILVVGNMNRDEEMRKSSACGPGSNNSIKPDLVAPGTAVISSVPSHKYDEMTGTSMSCPQVAGVIALMLSKNPDLTEDEIKQALIQSTEPINVEADLPNDVCRKIPLDQYPNYRAGHGMLNALKAFNSIKSPA